MVLLPVRVTPRAAKPGIGGWREGADGRLALEVRVSAAPADGQANDSVLDLLSRALDVPRRALSIASGATARNKRIEVELDEETLATRLPPRP